MAGERYRLFLSYAHEDAAHAERLRTHLGPHCVDGRVELWYDREIAPGADWDAEITDKIESCDGVAFLVSPDLVGSRYVQGVEMRKARERLTRGEIDVFPIPVNYTHVDGLWIGSRQGVINPEKPIVAYAHADQAWAEVIKAVLARVEARLSGATEAGPGFAMLESASGSRKGAVGHQGDFEWERAPYVMRGAFFGREAELEALDGWLDGDGPYGAAQVLALQAIGGMGKSALAWTWEQNHAPRRGRELGYDGVMWWSFYNVSDHARAFAIAALDFLGVDAAKMPKGFGPQLELLAEIARKRKVIFVLDGFERELLAYNRQDAPDDAEAAAAASGARHPYDCVDPEFDAFLKRLAATARKSRWLLTTRVTPEALRDAAGAQEVQLRGLSAPATRALFAAQGVSASEADLARLEALYGGHGLTLSVLARTLKRLGIPDVGAPEAAEALAEGGDEATRRLKVLIGSVEALPEEARAVLESFLYVERAPSLAMLQRLNNHLEPLRVRAALGELRAHGLLDAADGGFTYELHPVVREAAARGAAGTGLERAIDVFERLKPRRGYRTLEEAQPAIDLFRALAQAGRFDAAWSVYAQDLRDLFNAEGAAERQAALLDLLRGPDGRPRLSEVDAQIGALRWQAAALNQLGRFGEALAVATPLMDLAGRPQVHANDRAAARIDFAAQAIAAGKLSRAEQALSDEVSDAVDLSWRLHHRLRSQNLRVLRQSTPLAPSAAASLWGQAKDLSVNSRSVFAYDLCNLAWSLQQRRLLRVYAGHVAEASAALEAPFHLTLAEFNILRARLLKAERAFWSNSSAFSGVVDAAQALAGRFAELELAAWRDEARLLAARAAARLGRERARAAAEEARALALSRERNGAVLYASQAYLVAAEAARRAGDLAAAREDAQAAKRLAYCDGPPYAAKLYEDRADALLRKLR